MCAVLPGLSWHETPQRPAANKGAVILRQASSHCKALYSLQGALHLQHLSKRSALGSHFLLPTC